MHIVAAVDTTQATAADRIKLYVDGTEITSFSSATYPSQDFAGSHWTSGEAHHIGNFKGVSDHFDGQMAEFVSVDGQALDASSFGQDDGSGNWVPVDVSGLDHGANGFHLDFADANNLGADVNGATSLAANLVPAMTSATGPEGTVTHSSELSSTYAAYQAFDGAKTVGGNEGAWVSGAAPSGGSPQWLAYEFASSKVVSQYAVTAGTANVATNAPKDWTFEGWDGSAWVTLDTVTAETGWSNSETRSFSFANTTSYQKYRLAVTANNGHSNEVTVGELEIGGQGPLFAAVNIDAADQSLDSPSRNYAVMTDDWAVAATQTMFTLSEGGLRLETSGIGGRFAGSTLMFDAGQWAFEATHTVMSAGRSYRAVGVGSQDWFTDGDFNNNDAFFYQEDGTVWDGSAWVAYGAAWGVNDVIRTEVDYANGTIEWFKNDVSQGRLNVSFNPISYAAGVYSGGNGSDSITLDFGQHGFTHTPTAGFQALTAQNLDGTTFGDPIVTPTEGHDSIEGTAEADTIDGLSGDDQLIGNEGADILYGVSGDDRLLGGDGADRLYGGAGDDVLAGGSGDDRLLGGEESDTADFGDAASAVTADLSQASAGGEVTATIGAETDTLVSIENLVGSDHGDTLTGDDGANDLSGGGGADTLAGGAGDDTLSGGADGDSLVGGEGVDTVSYQDSDSAVTIDLQADTAAGGHAAGDELDGIENLIGSGHGDVLTGDGNANDLAGGGGADTVSGGDGDDTLSGGDDDDVMAGDAGHDVLSGGGGSDSLDGGAGDDILAGGAGNDELIGGEGLDTADYLDAQADVSVDLSQTTVTATVGADHDTLSGIENVIGSAHGDTLTGDGGANVFDGNAGADIVEGGDGDDTVSGGADDDTVSGGDGVDTLTGGDGADLLFGDAGDDDLDGGLGDDVLTGGAGADTLDGGLGVNTVSYLGSDSAVTVDLSDYSAAGGHAEGDVLVTSTIHNLDGSRHGDTLTGDDGVNVLTGNAGTDTLVGGLGDDTLAGGSGGDTLDGGDGSDTASYEGSWSGVSVNLSTGQGSGGHAQGDALSNIENVEGSDFDDALTGDAGVNTLSGGDGDDVLAGGAGGDRLIGGLGSDTAGYQDSDSAVTIDLQADTAAGGHATGDDLDGIENLIGSDHADTLTGDGNDNVLTGGAGGDTLTGGLGSDTVSYSGSDAGVTVDLLSDTATGGHASGDDLDGIENLTGSGHDDTLTGDGGDNILAGGAGNDVLTGGAGIDAADYQDSQGAVTVDRYR